MEREVMREIIKRNREALGVNGQCTTITEMVVDALVEANNYVSIETFSNPNHEPIFLADGLVVGYDVGYEV